MPCHPGPGQGSQLSLGVSPRVQRAAPTAHEGQGHPELGEDQDTSKTSAGTFLTETRGERGTRHEMTEHPVTQASGRDH